MKAEQIAALIERVEAAEASEQREMLLDAFDVCFPEPKDTAWWALRKSNAERLYDWRFWRLKRLVEAKAWTDAALTLLPEGWRKAYDDLDDGRSLWRLEQDEREVYGKGATIALALVAACLRALLEQERDPR